MDTLAAPWDTLIVSPLADSLRLLALPFAATVPLGVAGALAIIVLAVAVYVVLLPLSLAQVRSWRTYVAVQPEFGALQRKFRDDREGLTRAQAALARARGLNPAAGCLPLLLHWPVLVGVYAAIVQLATSGDPPFSSPVLWLASLGQPDLVHLLGYALPGPLLGLMALAAFGAQRVATLPTADPQQQHFVRIAAVVPLLYFLVFLKAPAGLVLYWLVNQLLAIALRFAAAGRPPGRLRTLGAGGRGPRPSDGAGRGATLPWRPVAPSDHAAATPDQPALEATDEPRRQILRRRAGRLG